MKKVMVFIVAFSSFGLVCADAGSYEFGLSDPAYSMSSETVTEKMLEQQRNASPPVESELPAQLYVDSQRRISDTFKLSIPESLQERADSLKQSD
ncbi:hypothetical protein [Alcanivorax sp.]|uniref:hypothetical protein n=1 Tax=Alcanivorax sp. TaxID=1872427 RepID=UPI0032D9418A